MIRRIAIVALFTGSAHLVSILTISYLLRNLGERASGFIGIVDSLVFLITGIVSFGVQLSVNRNVAIQKNWKSNYHLGQSARFSTGLLLVLFGFTSFYLNWDQTKLAYFLAPIIALNGDYALYGSGRPIQAARLSFFRVLIPYGGLLLAAMYLETEYVIVYIVLIGVGVFISGFFSSRINRVKYLFPINKNFIKFYLKYYKVGLYQLSSVLLITGILALAQGFYSIEVIGLVYGLLKVFEIFKGGLRIIVQAFFREVRFPETGLRIDKLGIIIGGFVIIPAFLYTQATLNLLFAQTYDGKELMLLLFGGMMFIASFKASADIRVLLKKADNVNLFAYLTALSSTLVIVLLLSMSEHHLFGIPYGLFAGEIVLLVILGSHLGGWQFFTTRILFLFRILPILIIPLAIRLILPPSATYLFISCAIYILLVLYVFRNLMFGSSLQKS